MIDRMDEIVRNFATALRQTRELETEKLRFTLCQLERFRDAAAAVNADLRSIAAKMAEPINRSDGAH
jgi:hypothetical protein